LCRKLQQRSDRPLDGLSVDALHTGTDSSRSPSTELELAPKDSRAFVTERPSKEENAKRQQYLTLSEEKALVKYLLRMSNNG
jgi:hypothetical protein